MANQTTSGLANGADARDPTRIGPSGLRSYQQDLIDQIQRMEPMPSFRPVNLVQRAIAPMRTFNIDERLIRYCIGAVQLDEQLKLLHLLSQTEAFAAAPQSYPVAGLPEALRPDPDPFRLRAAGSPHR